RGQSCDVPARTYQIRHYANAEGVANGAHDDGYRRGGLLRGEHGVGTPRENDVYVEADELIRQLGKSLVAPLTVAVLEANVLTLDIPEIIEMECALDSGQFQAAVLTGCWAWRSSYCAGLR